MTSRGEIKLSIYSCKHKKEVMVKNNYCSHRILMNHELKMQTSFDLRTGDLFDLVR
jgi:hypothetical protein